MYSETKREKKPSKPSHRKRRNREEQEEEEFLRQINDCENDSFIDKLNLLINCFTFLDISKKVKGAFCVDKSKLD